MKRSRINFYKKDMKGYIRHPKTIKNYSDEKYKELTNYIVHGMYMFMYKIPGGETNGLAYT